MTVSRLLPPRAAASLRAVAAVSALGVDESCARRSARKIRIGYWPIAAGLPLYAAVEKWLLQARSGLTSRRSSAARSR